MKQRRHRQLALAVDTDVDDVLGVELEVEPAAAVRDDPRGEEILAAGVGLAAVMVNSTPGERCIWLTITRSVPLMMKVPFCVMSGMSPM